MKTGDIKISINESNRHYSSVAKVTSGSIELYDSFPHAIKISIDEWKRLMRFHKSIVKAGREWIPKKTPMPEDGMAHHFGTLFIDQGLSYFVCRIGPKGPIGLKRYDGKVTREKQITTERRQWAPDVTISNVSVIKINAEILDQERGIIRKLKKEKSHYKTGE
jgi:hypothetical protein